MWRDRTRAALTWGIVGVSLITLAIGGPAILTGIAAIYGIRRVNRAYPRDEAAAQQAATRSDRLSAGPDSWRSSSLPLDMELTRKSGLFRPEATFKAAGIDGLVTGRQNLLGRVDYTVPVRTMSDAMGAKDYIAERNLDAKVEQKDGSYSVRCSDLSTANELAKYLYPIHKASVERETVHARQYLVEGARNYEEAVAMLSADRSNGRLLTSYVTSVDTVDGVKCDSQENGWALDSSFNGGMLRVGSYIVTEKEVMKSSGTVDVPADVRHIDSYVLSNFSSGGTSVSETAYEESMPKGMKRYFVPSHGHQVELKNPLDAEAVAQDGLKAFMVFDDMEQMRSFMDAGVAPEGSYVGVAKDIPEVSEGKYVLELPLADPKVRSAVYLQENLPASVQVALSGMGVSEEAAEYSRLVDAVGRNRETGVANGVLRSGLELDGVMGCRVNGVNYSELAERVCDHKRLPEMDAELMKSWMKEAEEIKSVTMEVDVTRSVFRISSVVGDDPKVKVEEFALTARDIESLSRRGTISKVEMKDMLMQLHPEYFSTYSNAEGKSLFADPMRSFLDGSRPEKTKAVEPVKEKQKKNEKKVTAVKQQKKEKTSRKKSKLSL